MKTLITTLTLLLTLTVTTFAQNEVVNNTDKPHLTKLAEAGLEELGVEDIILVINPLTPEIKKSLKIEGKNVGALATNNGEKFHTIFWDEPEYRNEVQLLAHELIHVLQAHVGIKYADDPEKWERKANSREDKVAERIVWRVGYAVK